MTLRREDVDRRAVDFSDVRSGRRLAPVHPRKICATNSWSRWRSACTGLHRPSRFRGRG